MILTLDYSKPPPGYYGAAGGVMGVVGSTYAVVPLAAAWVHYKASNDPPGCSDIFQCGRFKGDRVVRGWTFRFCTDSDGTIHVDRSVARVAAWAWHDRRLVAHERVVNDSRHQIEISTRGDGVPPPCPTWPRFLNCSDAEIGEVERWLADSEARFPEVLLG